ncbi:MAG: hypothetical protein ACOC4S_02465 [Balneolaceae bacterium]
MNYLKRLFYCLPLLCLLSMMMNSAVLAQSDVGNSIAIDVSASVVEATVDLVTIQEIQFQNVQPSQGEIHVDPLENANAGLLRAEGSPNAPVRIRFQPELELNRLEGTESLTFFYEVAGGLQDEQDTAELLEEDNRDLELNDQGHFYIWVGGRVNIENAVNGQYEGEFTLEVEYL